ncbi:MAG TPA: hydroxymethylbilane synthase [Planctomicrobium sp.]|nr:hydroxymethylbilane synthase [Planctomicrobium sp.]
MTVSSRRTLRIATRESQLALWQANYVADEIRRMTPSVDVQLVPMTTAGDRDLKSSLPSFGGQGVFTREVQRAVLSGSADLAVHSLKDLPTEATPGLVLAGIPQRASRFDALVLPDSRPGTLDDLPIGARVGTSSPRRRSQLLRIRPDLQLFEIRGNVETRLSKVDQGEFGATILAEAGLRRLGLEARISSLLIPPVMFPAVGQAALGIECRDDDSLCQEILAGLSDPQTRIEVLAERACLRELRAGCHAPVGVWSEVRESGNDQQASTVSLQAVVLDQEGTQFFQVSVEGPAETPEQVGIDAARQLIACGATAVL